MKRRHLWQTAAAFCVSCALTFAVHQNASAVGTRTFRLDTLEDLSGGELEGTSVDSLGRIRAGLLLGKQSLPGATSVWASIELKDGSILLGTGNGGKVFRVAAGQVTEYANTGELAVTSFAIDARGTVLAGTIPNGKVLRLDGPGKFTKVIDLPNAEHIWALAYDAKTKSVFAGTGPEGKLYRIDEADKAQVHFDSDEAHILSLAVAKDGIVYAGSSGSALLYRLTAPGRASVVYDFAGDDVKALAFGPDGRLYAISNEHTTPPTVPKRGRSAATEAADPVKPANLPKPGKGTLTRFELDGRPEQLYYNKDTHFQSLAIGTDGLPYVGTADKGEIYAIDDAHTSMLMADTQERQVGAMVLSGGRKFVATSDPATYREVRGVGGPDSIWTSKVLDSGLRARYGRLDWQASGPIEFSTRTGSTEKPDGSWSDWSAPLANPGDITSPGARYLQVRARFAPKPDTIVRRVDVAFVTDNVRAVVTSVKTVRKGESAPDASKDIPSSGDEPPKHNSIIKVSWKVDNPDNDELRYRVYYRTVSSGTWRTALSSDEVLTKLEFEWETAGLPEGIYRVLLEASDELANPPAFSKRHALESPSIIVDNTPPLFQKIAVEGRRVQGAVVDGVGPIARFDVSIDPKAKLWIPFFPKDGVFDERSEDFDWDLAPVVGAKGSHLVAIRAFDAAGNSVVRTIEVR